MVFFKFEELYYKRKYKTGLPFRRVEQRELWVYLQHLVKE